MSRVPGKSPRVPGISEHRRPPRVARPRTTEQPSARMDPILRSRADGVSSALTVSSEESDPDNLLRQNYQLRHRLEEESATYKRRIDAYRQAQQNQATLVSRLQAKVLQYKQRCSELETQMIESVGAVGSPVKQARPRVDLPADSAYAQAQKHLQELREERIQDLDTALRRLEEEKKKSDKLMQLNTILKDQLEESHQTNEALTNDLQKLTNDWEQMREEIIIKEDEWKDEEQAFNDYYSNEHSRLLGLWRNVVSVKRLFSDMQSTNERDLLKLKSELTNISRDMTSACTKIGDTVSKTDTFGFKQRAQYEKETADLRQQILNITTKYDSLQLEVNVKEDRIQQLLHDVHNLEERCGDAEQSMGQLGRMQEEMELLHSALRDIAHAVIQDAETLDVEAIQRASHVHLTPSTPVPQKSPKRGITSLVTPAFAESTISAVHASLHKYQSLIHELQVKLQSSREQLVLVRRQCENADEANSALESRIAELVPQLDACRTHGAQLTQEKDLLQKSLDAMRAEKNSLERNRVELNSMIESLNSENEKLQKTNTKLQKLTDSLTDEKLFLQTDVDRLNQDANIREINFRTEEERCSRLHEELLTAREELNKMYLSQDMLEQQKMESDGLIAALERTKGDVKQELERTLNEQMNAQGSMVKLETVLANLEGEKKKLQTDLKKTEEEKQALQTQCTDQLNDIASLRKELLHAEQTRLDLESDKVTLSEKAKFLEIEKEKVEVDLNQVTRERSDLSNQLSQLARKKEVLNEELMRLRQRLEQASENNARINRNLEDLVKETEEKQILLEANAKELQRLQEQLASLHSEKESLEALLFDSQTNLEASDIKRSQLEKEQQELLVKQETLKGTVCRLTKDLENSEKRAQDIKASLTQQSGSMEVEFQQTVSNLKKHNEDTMRKLTEERELVRTTLEKQMQQSLTQVTNEKDSEIQQLLDRIESLQQHMENVCEQHEELLLRAENDKQQALLIAHHDQQALQERYASLRHDLETERETLERLRRETSTRIDQDRIMINQLKEELARAKSKFDELRQRAEDERNVLELRIAETQKERDHAQIEAQETKVQLHLYEDKIDDLNNQLQDTQRKLKEIENTAEGLRKDLTDVRRQLADTNYEKDKYQNTNKELRDHVKRTESEKREVSRELEEAFQKISSMEEVKLTLENERTRLQTQLRDVERDQMQGDNQLQTLQQELQSMQAANIRHQAEEKELMARLSNESDERERLQQEFHQQKKKTAELESSLSMTRQDLGRLRSHAAEEEERWHAREQELLVRLEDSRNKEKKLEDQKHNLEVCLTDATQQIQELKARLGGAEGRVRGLDAQLSQLEATKRDIEQKLSSVVSTLRRIAGIQLDGSVNLPYRLLSPSRRYSPVRAQEISEGRGSTITDVDPEIVRKGVRNLMQQVAQIERERDDYKTQMHSVKKQLHEVSEIQTKGDSKLNSLLQNFRALQDEKTAVEAKLAQKNAALQAQTEALQQKTEEAQQIRDKVVSMELNLHNTSEEKGQYEEKLEKMKNNLGRIDSEKRSLEEALNRSENRSTKLELQRVAMEGDIQRLQMMLQEKDMGIQKIQEKCDSQGRTIASLEERCVSLKSTIDQLNSSLERAALTETELRSEIQSLQRSLLEITATSHSGSEKLKQLQKMLANTENEKRVCHERLDTTQQSAAELRRANQQLQDQLSRLNTELANNEVLRSGLESQLRLSQWPQDTSSSSHRDEDLLRQLHSTQRERSELRGKVDSLASKIRQLENEKHQLERQAAKASTSIRSKSYERPEKSDSYESESISKRDSNLEQENRELRVKIRQLEQELAERESQLMRLKSQRSTEVHFDKSSEMEQIRAAQLQAERLLEAREASHRQQVLRLENQVRMLREQLNEEVKRRQLYIMRSTRAGQEMQQLRQALGDSLRTVSQDPSLDAGLLEHETRKLDSQLSHSAVSLPPALGRSPTPHFSLRSPTPQPK